MIHAKSNGRPGFRQRDASGRRGAAFLVLTFMLLVIVMSSIQWMIRQEVSDRRAIRQTQRIRILESAIAFAQSLDTGAADQASADAKEAMILPIGDVMADSKGPDRRVRVLFDRSNDQWVASWLIGDVEHETIRRKQTQ